MARIQSVELATIVPGYGGISGEGAGSWDFLDIRDIDGNLLAEGPNVDVDLGTIPSGYIILLAFTTNADGGSYLVRFADFDRYASGPFPIKWTVVSAPGFGNAGQIYDPESSNEDFIVCVDQNNSSSSSFKTFSVAFEARRGASRNTLETINFNLYDHTGRNIGSVSITAEIQDITQEQGLSIQQRAPYSILPVQPLEVIASDGSFKKTGKANDVI